MITGIFQGYSDVLQECLMALIPLIIIVLFFQLKYLKLSKKKLIKLVKGILTAFFGLTLFLQGVQIGYIPVGEKIGYMLADLDYNWILVPIGFALGFAVTLAEPSVYVLVQQIEKATGGYLKKKLLLATICIGVALSIALAMVKLLMGISLWLFIIPGYIAAFVMSRFIDDDFTAVAFDSGGVATGTMTATFILSMALGVAKRIDHTDPLLDGFGIISIVALTPILTIQFLGLLYKRKEDADKNVRNSAEGQPESNCDNCAKGSG